MTNTAKKRHLPPIERAHALGMICRLRGRQPVVALPFCFPGSEVLRFAFEAGFETEFDDFSAPVEALPVLSTSAGVTD